MEYLVLAGSDLQATLAQTLGEYAPFFWSVIAPVGLAILWLGGIYVLFETLFRGGNEEDTGGSFLFKLVFGLVTITIILCAGAGLEFLVLGEGHVQASILAGVVDLVRGG
ncbi:MAG: hypothetical protein ABIF09_02980 [Gemmatimonadota bacterium]